ncbi:MAG: GMC family oxidoreductase [Myxococcota bacterium]
MHLPIVEHVPVSVRRGYPDDPENFREGAVVDGKLVRRDQTDIADFVVIGSGAAGATASMILAQRGFSVIVLEEGAWIRTKNISPDLNDGFRDMFRDAGTHVGMGQSMFPVLQGRCVGGSTAVNSSIAWRPPADVLHRWGRQYGLGETLSPERLEPHFQDIERALGVRSVGDSVLGESNRLFGEAAGRIGIRAERMRRYEQGCEGLGLCLTGCPHGKKMSMNVTHVPSMLHAGGRIYTSAKVQKVLARDGRAYAVLATVGGRQKRSLEVVARRGILLAASAVQTPGIMRRTGLKASAIGRHFMTHPGVSMAACFDRKVGMEHGATQGMNSLEFEAGVGFKLETVGAPPELAALRLTGTGPTLIQRMMSYDNVVNWAVVVKAEAEGRVMNIFGKEQVFYTMAPTDLARMRKGLKMLTQMMFEMGAKEVYPGVHGMPAVLRSGAEVRAWDQAPLDPRAYVTMASHLFGTARMGPAPGSSAVDLNFQTHELPGLYVVDSSLFPTNLGVNPQHSIMAVARLAANQLAG